MPFISSLTNEACRWSFFFKQGIKIATGRQRFRNFLEALRVIAYSTVGCIRKHLRRNFRIKPGCFPRTHSHFTTVSEYKHQFGTVRSNNALAFTNHVAQL
jgi:hypothetical protein